jgi:hypothetical protein
MFHLFDWWSGLSPFWRYGVGLLFLAISTLLWLGGTLWPWGWIVGVVLLLLGGPSDSEKKGYRF